MTNTRVKATGRYVGECHRTVQWRGEVEEIVVDHHIMAFRGQIPCTGPIRCIYCGMHLEDLKHPVRQTLLGSDLRA